MAVTDLKTIREIHDAFDAKKLSPLELTQAYLNAAKQEKLNAYITVAEEGALRQAQSAQKLLEKEGRVPREKYPLLGIPLGIKDILTTEGLKTTCASRMLEDYVPPYSATVVERLESAGAVTLGKLNMDEFAMGGSNENSAFGPVKHPTHADRVPGGSSGGSSAAVRADLCFAALGTDTGGSIRLPAHFSGIFGMKPTYGRVSRYGLVAFASSMDQVGPMTRTAEDGAAILDVVAGPDPKDSTCAVREKGNWLKAIREQEKTRFNWKGVRVGVPKEYFVGGLSADVEKSVQESLKWLQSQGAEMVDISLPHTKYSVAVYYIVAISEASSNLARYDSIRFGVRPEGTDESRTLLDFYKHARKNFGPEVKRRIILGTFALSSGYYDAYFKRACQVRHRMKQDFDEAFKKVDVICSPVSPSTAFKLGEKVSDPLQMYLNDIFTIPANCAGLPALSIPCGEDAQGLPIGFHMVGPHFGDERLLVMAHSFEKGRA